MCGIIAYSGKRQAAEVLLSGLSALEYRGYDSAGMYIEGHDPLYATGAVQNLADLNRKHHTGTAGIAHTRWATHGVPSRENTHPHTDCEKKLFLVHNGIIENYQRLKEKLLKAGHTFRSETDTEVLAHLIEEELASKNHETFQEAVLSALNQVQGTFGIALSHKEYPNEIFTARMGSPIVIGFGNGEHFIASDPGALLRYTNKMLYLEDGECAIISADTYRVISIENQTLKREPQTIEGDASLIQKEGFDHFMQKEIFEAPEVIEMTLRGRLDRDNGTAHLGGLRDVEQQLRQAKRLVIVGCGSAYYAALVGKYLLEEYANIPVDVEIASEYRYKNTPKQEGVVVVAISQSGETADTLACIKEAKRKGLLTLGIVNVVGSTIARETTAGVYNHAGPEISVASTKAFISQLTAMVLLTLYLGRRRTLSLSQGQALIDELYTLPKKIHSILESQHDIERIAHRYADATNFLFLGRKYHFPLAFEGALKLKEVSYIHAEGYGSGEMKHGPLAMIDESFPTLVLCPRDSVYEKNISNIEEIRARSGPVVAIGNPHDTTLRSLVDDVIEIPKTLEPLAPILSVVPLQLFAYFISTKKGLNVDRPRNLAKSVTVE